MDGLAFNDAMVEIIRLALTVALAMLGSFVLGASVMWSLEARRRDRQPLWLVIARNLMLTILSGLVFFGPDVRGGVIEITREVWIGLGIFSTSASVLAFVLELRQRRSGGGETT
jgi:hypothetical protein